MTTPVRRPLDEVCHEPAEPVLKLTVKTLSRLLWWLTKPDWQGMENIPQTGGALFVINHTSNFDPLAAGQFLAYAGRWPRYMAKDEIFKVPGLGWVARNAGQIMVERNGPNAIRALEAAEKALAEGKSISMYPEGTITADPEVWPMVPKTGAARIALHTGVPVIPIGQWGANFVLPGKKLTYPRLFPRKTMIVKAGAPVPLDDLRAKEITREVIDEASDRIMNAITDIVAELRGEEPPATRWNMKLGRREDPR